MVVRTSKVCPKCGSVQIWHRTGFTGKEKYHCFACTSDFKTPVFKEKERNDFNVPAMKRRILSLRAQKIGV